MRSRAVSRVLYMHSTAVCKHCRAAKQVPMRTWHVCAQWCACSDAPFVPDGCRDACLCTKGARESRRPRVSTVHKTCDGGCNMVRSTGLLTRIGLTMQRNACRCTCVSGSLPEHVRHAQLCVSGCPGHTHTHRAVRACARVRRCAAVFVCQQPMQCAI